MDNYVDGFRARLDLITRNAIPGMDLSEDALKERMLGALFSAPFETAAKAPTKAAEDKGNVTTMESSSSKNERELNGVITSWLGDKENPRFTDTSADFYLNPQLHSSWAKQRIEGFFRELGLSTPTSEGSILKALLDREAGRVGQPIPDLQGDAPSAVMMRTHVRKAMLRFLSIFTVVVLERNQVENGGKALSPAERREKEDVYMKGAMNPAVDDRFGSETLRILSEKVGISRKALRSTESALESAGGGSTGKDSAEAPSKRLKKVEDKKATSEKKGLKEGDDLPAGWASMDDAAKKALCLAGGWCIRCLDLKPPKWKKGVAVEHDAKHK